MGSTGSAGKAPQYRPINVGGVASTQQKLNVDSAKTGLGLSTPDMVSPVGGVSYTRNDDGTYTAKVSYSPTEKPLYNASVANRGQFASMISPAARALSTQLSKPLTPLDLSETATENRLFDLGSTRLTPQLDQRRDSEEQRLANQGLTPGSEAYARAMTQVGQDENDAWNQLLLTGHSTATSDILNEHNANEADIANRLNEIGQLYGWSQPMSPTSMFQPTPDVNVQPVNYADLFAANNSGLNQSNQFAYNAKVEQQKIKAQQQAALYGAIGGAVGTAAGGWATGGFKV